MKPTVTAVGQLRLLAKLSVAARMRRCALAILLLGTALGSSPAQAKDPCEMVLCMWGKREGASGGSECKKAEAEYFSILVFRKKKRIDWGATSKERLKSLNSCSSADRGKTKQINDKFGKSRG